MLSSYTHLGPNHIHFEEIDSTNLYAKLLLSKTTPRPGTVISADFQHLGKGQLDRQWHSAKGQNLTFSVIFYPTFLEPSQQFLLSIITCLSIKDYLSSLEISNISLKWPNDILVNNKKLAGILILNTINSQKLQSSIIGIGLNLNQYDFPQNLNNATSISLLTGKFFHPASELNKLLKILEVKYNFELKSNPLVIKEDFEKYLLGINSIIKYSTNKIDFSFGKILGIDFFGRLLIMDCNSQMIHPFIHGEVVVDYDL